jgi:hypothetical protein
VNTEGARAVAGRGGQARLNPLCTWLPDMKPRNSDDQHEQLVRTNQCDRWSRSYRRTDQAMT